MLTSQEKLLFIVLVIASLIYTFIGFRNVYRVIRRFGRTTPAQGTGWSRHSRAVTWITTKPIWKTRPTASIFHAMVAWGFIFYFLVNFGDVLQGLLPITFMGEGIFGDLYRLLADLFTVSVLIGMVYFLLRRFVFHSKALTYRDNVMLMDKVKKGGIPATR